jgi:hypothetical protein
MGKRSTGKFKRIARDFYPTPYEAASKVFPYLSVGTLFCEPCAGDGQLVRHLVRAGHHCTAQYDILPMSAEIGQLDALEMTPAHTYGADAIITNTPWRRDLFHPMITRFLRCAPVVWLLADADWAYTKQAAPYLVHCRKIVTIGRVKWQPGSAHTGKDNSAWYQFTRPTSPQAQFYGWRP